ncbi:PRAME family member 7-like [Ochotona princeps]|uniref:PRAME family member 7-like n=1 Tax=Ochotona princeps TaxID=9978 RepID=UPI002714A910|nr:PRAME family member 7-like [Ochotona princeps]
MKPRAPPTLQELAAKCLMQFEALALATVPKLPPQFFPALFLEAYGGRHSEILKVMVQSWPFACLPLGALMRTPHLRTLMTVLDGLEDLLTGKVCHRPVKLQVVELRDIHHEFWNVWSGGPDYPSCPKATHQRLVLQHGPRPRARKTLKVSIELYLKDETLDKFLSHLFLWVEERKGLLHVVCERLRILAMPIRNVNKVLNFVELDSIREVEVLCPWKLTTLAKFAPYLGRMINVWKLRLSHVRVSGSLTAERREELISEFISHFHHLDCLQELHLDSMSFLQDHLKEMLRCLKSPLEVLYITDCLLSEADVRYLSRCPNVGGLKYLCLSGVALTRFSPRSLRVLLERAAATLKVLELENCRMIGSRFRTILPAISQCCQLTRLNCLQNYLPMAVLRSLLHRTIKLKKLRLELYPLPLELCGMPVAESRSRLEEFCGELMETLTPFIQTRKVWFGTLPCPTCNNQAMYDMQSNRCLCCVPS